MSGRLSPLLSIARWRPIDLPNALAHCAPRAASRAREQTSNRSRSMLLGRSQAEVSQGQQAVVGVLAIQIFVGPTATKGPAVAPQAIDEVQARLTNGRK